MSDGTAGRDRQRWRAIHYKIYRDSDLGEYEKPHAWKCLSLQEISEVERLLDVQPHQLTDLLRRVINGPARSSSRSTGAAPTVAVQQEVFLRFLDATGLEQTVPAHLHKGSLQKGPLKRLMRGMKVELKKIDGHLPTFNHKGFTHAKYVPGSTVELLTTPVIGPMWFSAIHGFSQHNAYDSGLVAANIILIVPYAPYALLPLIADYHFNYVHKVCWYLQRVRDTGPLKEAARTWQ